jgi:PAS domain S-box-containing protein
MISGSSGPERNPASCPGATKASRTPVNAAEHCVPGSGANVCQSAPLASPRYALEALLQALHEFVIVLDDDGFIRTVWSSSQFHGRDPEVPLLGRQLSDVLDQQTYEQLTELAQRTVAAGRSQIVECTVRLADGPRWFSVRALPVADTAGRRRALWLIALDISHRQGAMEALQKSEALLAQAEELANMGSFDVNLETGEIFWSAQLYRALRLDPAKTSLTKEFLLQFVHPDDRERVRQDGEINRNQPQPFEHEAHWIRSDGKIRTMYTRGVPVVDSSGRVNRVFGISQDITERKQAEDRLRKSEALLAQAEEIANFGSWEFEVRTRKVMLSKQLLKVMDVAPEAEWTEEMYWKRLHPIDRQQARDTWNRALAECKRYEFVTRYYTRDGRIRVHFVRGVPVSTADGTAERVIGFLQDITERAQAEEELRRLSQELIRADDEGRRRTARELHESAGQSLAALKMALGCLKESLPEENCLAHELLQSSMELADGAIREVRTVSYLMHPPLLDEAGLSPALRWYAKGFAERSGIQVEIEIPENFGRASREIETTVFRIVQESLTNVHRYSGSRTAKIRLARESDQIRAEVRDEGCGLAMPSHAGSGPLPAGVGIAGMRERVKQLNGVFEMESAPGRGTTVRAILPVAPKESPHHTIHPQHASNAEKKQRRKGKHAIR